MSPTRPRSRRREPRRSVPLGARGSRCQGRWRSSRRRSSRGRRWAARRRGRPCAARGRRCRRGGRRRAGGAGARGRPPHPDRNEADSALATTSAVPARRREVERAEDRERTPEARRDMSQSSRRTPQGWRHSGGPLVPGEAGLACSALVLSPVAMVGRNSSACLFIAIGRNDGPRACPVTASCRRDPCCPAPQRDRRSGSGGPSSSRRARRHDRS